MVRQSLLLLTVSALVQFPSAPTFAAEVATVAAVPVASQHPLLVLERQRASVVQRIVGEWADVLPTLPAERRLTKEQFAESLWQLRADRLLAASLAGSFAAVEALLADAQTERAELLRPQRVATKALGNASADLVYTPINPCRIADTRIVGGPLLAGAQRTFDGFSANFSTQGGTATTCGMPNGVAAVGMNVYAVNPTNLGFIKVWGANAAEPAVSTVNYQTGTVAIATGAIVPVDSANSNRFIAKSPAQVDFIADVVGYFRSPLNVATGAFEVAVGGDLALRIVPDASSPMVIAGSSANTVTAGASGAAIGGGGAPGTSISANLCGVSCANRVTDYFGTIGGGAGNQAGDGAGTSSDGAFATVGGGLISLAWGFASTVSGGQENAATGNYATVAGGRGNQASTVRATVGGGSFNVASGDSSTIIGGSANTANGGLATVAGGYANIADGVYSFAAGSFANADFAGCFVWGDSSTTNQVRCNQPNRFVVRAVGGIYMFTGGAMQGSYTGVQLPPGANAWIATSDRAGKDNLRQVDAKSILRKVAAMPIATWNWKSQDASIRHMGPMAQDFHAAFGLGETPKGISTIDADGVALAAIQGLHAELRDRDIRIVRQNAKIGALELALTQLKRAVEALADKR